MRKGSRWHMNRNLYRVLSVTACLLMLAVFLAVALTYTHPMYNKVYDLSLRWPGETMPDNWSYDQKGWTVFTQEGSAVTQLVPDGYGRFSGLSYPGQIFYFSRTLAENLDAPTLRLDAGGSGVAVFLDGELLYSDELAPESRIGSLTLSVPDRERLEPVVVTLPMDYRGKTLTIAQASGPDGGTLASPCSAALYCACVYDSGLISESFQVALPAAFLFLTGIFLLGFFLWQVFHDRGDIGLVCAAAAAFLWMTSRMAQASFAHTFFDWLPENIIWLCRDLSHNALLAFLATRCSGKRAAAMGVLTGLQGLSTAVCGSFLFLGRNPLAARPTVLGLLSLLAALGLGVLEWRQENSRFFRLFSLLMAGGSGIYAAVVCLLPGLRHEFLRQTFLTLPAYFVHRLSFLMMAAAIIAGVAAGLRRELDRRIEAKLLEQRRALAQAAYESMRKHQEHVMILRHDIMKHLRLLRLMTGERYVADYLDEIIGENETIRPIVQSGNEMLDIILNGRLAAAVDAGVKIDLVRTQAPAVLPLSSMELCALFVNVMDNAVAAAKVSKTDPPYIRLDLHVKGGFFVFSCKNSVSWDQRPKLDQADSLLQHGLGLKIIRRISQRYGDLMETERGSDYYKVIIAIPLAGNEDHQPSK